MLSHPPIGSAARVWYATRPKRRGARAWSEVMPLHGKVGIIRTVAKGPGPRNHEIEIEGKRYAVPRGNLRKP